MTHTTPLAAILALVDARRRKDLEAAFDCYAPEATVVFAPGQSGSGAATVRSFIASASELALEFEGHEVVESGAIALHVSGYVLDLGAQGRVSGRTADVLHRGDDGGWRIVIDNAFAAPATPA